MKSGFVVVEKLESFFEGEHPNRIEKGYTRAGYTDAIPTVGKRFEVFDASRWFHTSLVTKIIEDNEDNMVFQTENSVYRVTKSKLK